MWSLDFSTLDPTRLVSGSDDGTVRVWSISQRNSPLVIQNKANVCSVQFSPVNANVVAFGSADYKIYAYDLRHTLRPLVTLTGGAVYQSNPADPSLETAWCQPLSLPLDPALNVCDLLGFSKFAFSNSTCTATDRPPESGELRAVDGR